MRLPYRNLEVQFAPAFSRTGENEELKDTAETRRTSDTRVVRTSRGEEGATFVTGFKNSRSHRRLGGALAAGRRVNIERASGGL